MKWNSDRNEIAWLSLYVTQSFKGSSSEGKVVQGGTQNTWDSRMVWRYFQRLSYVRSFSSVEENTEDEREPETPPASKLGSLLRSKANWTNSRYSHVSVYFCQHAHWLCISCFFFKIQWSLFKQQASVANWISLSYCVLLQWRFPSRFSCLLIALFCSMLICRSLPYFPFHRSCQFYFYEEDQQERVQSV